MYGFLIKKSFCDGWDNLLSVVITNIISLFAILGYVFLSAFITNCFGVDVDLKNIDAIIQNPLFLGLQFGSFVLICVVLSIIAFAYAEVAAKIADFDGITIASFFKAIPGVLKDAILYGIMCAFLIVISFFCLDFYFVQSGSMFGVFMGALLFWIDIVLLLSLQWFIPLRANMHNNFKKCLKKSFIIFFDNTGFSILVFLHTLIMIALSVVLVGLIPSVSGIAINKANAIRLRLYKYDYLEEHPELKTKKERKHIPWDELLYDDKELLGPRKLKSFLFPWKE